MGCKIMDNMTRQNIWIALWCLAEVEVTNPAPLWDMGQTKLKYTSNWFSPKIKIKDKSWIQRLMALPYLVNIKPQLAAS